jgi:hypothetical protein
MPTFKTLSTPLLLTDSLSFQQVKKMIPKGYVVLTTDMARNALKDHNDAISFRSQIAKKDSVILIKDLIIETQNGAIDKGNQIAKIAKRKIFWNEVEKWSLRVLVIYLGGKQLKIIK